MFHHQWPKHIRLIDAPSDPGGGSDAEDQNETPQDIDWQAKYNDAIRHSREWEKRAKDNKNAAEELEKLKEASMTEQEKAAKHVKELEDKVASYETAKQRAEVEGARRRRDRRTADVIEGDSLEAMQSHAKRIHELLNPKPKAPAVHGADRQPSGKGPNESMVNYLRNLGL